MSQAISIKYPVTIVNTLSGDTGEQALALAKVQVSSGANVA